LTAPQAARADEVINVLSRLWPRCFQVFERRRRPLMIGIDGVLIEQMQPAIRARRIGRATSGLHCDGTPWPRATSKTFASSAIRESILDGRPVGA
jgi:hypothetical protein